MKKGLLLLAILLSLSGCNSNKNNNSTSDGTSFESSSASRSVYLDFYSINDFHGRISENQIENEPGISKMSSYLNDLKSKNEDGFVFLCAGDTFQDTYESHDNKGALIAECLNQMGCEAMALGNHDFDWGIDTIKTNQLLAGSCTFLGANVYNYPDISTFANVGKEYKIIERNGIKIGIIGTIGSTQNTSITSSIWEDISFLDTTQIVQDLSDYLRIEENCQVIIWTNHADYENSDPYNVTRISPKSNKKYVDAVFNAHSHRKEKEIYNKVPFIQGGSHGERLSHVQLLCSDNGDVKLSTYGYVGDGIMSYYPNDPNIDSIISKYHDEEYKTKKDTPLGTLTSDSSYYVDSHFAGSLIAKATYDLYYDDMVNYDVSFVINNGSRDSISIGTQTNETIFNMTPFTNKTYICKDILGSDLIKEFSYSSTHYYQVDENLTIDENSTYTIACIDYLLLHKNRFREYDYFSSYSSDNVLKIIDEYPYSIVSRYLTQKGTISESSFNNGNYR